MYRNYSAITNPELQAAVRRVAGFTAEQIEAIKLAGKVTGERYGIPMAEGMRDQVPAEVRQILEKTPLATKLRAICMRAPGDNPEEWRNAVPADRVPIVLDFQNAEKTACGYRFKSSPAADYDHANDYRYIGRDSHGNYQLFNPVLRSHRTDQADVGVLDELLLVSTKGSVVAMGLGNDGKMKRLPAEFREARILADVPTACLVNMQKVGDEIVKASAVLLQRVQQGVSHDNAEQTRLRQRLETLNASHVAYKALIS